MKKMHVWSRSLSLLLALIMVLGMIPAGVMAAEPDDAAEETVITIDFNAESAKSKAVADYSEETDGWAYDSSASSGVAALFYKHAKWDYKALRLTQNSVGGQGVLNFTAPKTGTYKMELTYCLGNNGNYVNAIVGGTTTEYFAWANWGEAPRTVTTEGVRLTVGSNPITFTTPEKVSSTSLIMVKQIKFTLVKETSEEDLSVVTLDFDAAAKSGKKLNEFTDAADGWSYDANNSSNVQALFYDRNEWDYSALRFTQTSPYGIGAISFDVPLDGTYTMELIYCPGNNCSATAVEVGGTTTEFYAYAAWGPDTKTVTAENVQLTAGSNRLTIQNTSGVAQLMIIRKIVFTRTGELVEIPKTKLNVSGMSWEIPVGNDAVYDGTEKSATLLGTLPAGVVATLSGHKATEVGTYTATAEFSLAEGYSADRFVIVGTNPLTRQWKVTAEPTAGLLIDLFAVANASADLKTYAVTGDAVSELGWGFNTDETMPGKNPGQTFLYYIGKGGTSQAPKLEDGTIPGVYFTSSITGKGSTINFYVPEDGHYRTEVTSVSNQRCGNGAIYVDDIYVGEYAGFAPDTPEYTDHSFNTVYLTKGVHKVHLHATGASDRYSNYYWMYLNRIEFVKQESAQQIDEIRFEIKKENVYVDDSVAYTVSATDKEGRGIFLGADLEGKLNYAVSSSDPETLKVENGRLYALKEGEADITVTVTLPDSEKTITKTLVVQGEPDAFDFELIFDQAHRGTGTLASITMDDHGWEVSGGTSGAWFSSWADEITFHGQYIGLVRKQLDTYKDALSIDFKAPATGDYRIDVSYVLRSVGGDVKVYLDGEYIGMYNGYSTTNWPLAEDSIKTVHL
ncbi:MAG: hypothetical protein IJO88_00110, partial [Oscillospiraceae bacterium]|nr:hypothetical protein [Oscillospiraceae bacterium]